MFEDIRIIGLDEARSHRPDPNTGMYNMYLQLSANAPADWCRLFEAEHKSRWSSTMRKATASGNYIVVHCPMSELEKHLETLKPEVQATNEQYRQHVAGQERQQQQKEQADQAERDQLTALKSKLKFV